MLPDSPGILAVDDDPNLLRMTRNVLKKVSDDVDTASSGKEAVMKCLSRSYDVVVSDLDMPEMDGIELMHLLAHDYPSIRRIILTGHTESEYMMAAINSGRVHRYLTKPWPEEEMLEVVNSEVDYAVREREEITRLRAVIDHLSS